MKEKHFHTPLFWQYRKQACDMRWEQCERETLSHSIILAVSQACLRYAMGASVKEKHFHTPLFMAVSQACLRYAMGASVKGKYKKKGATNYPKNFFLIKIFFIIYLWQYRKQACDMRV